MSSYAVLRYAAALPYDVLFCAGLRWPLSTDPLPPLSSVLACDGLYPPTPYHPFIPFSFKSRSFKLPEPLLGRYSKRSSASPSESAAKSRGNGMWRAERSNI